MNNLSRACTVNQGKIGLEAIEIDLVTNTFLWNEIRDIAVVGRTKLTCIMTIGVIECLAAVKMIIMYCALNYYTIEPTRMGAETVFGSLVICDE